MLSPCIRQVTHALLTRPPLSFISSIRRLPLWNSVRLACVRHAASVHPEPGSNSQFWVFVFVRITLTLPLWFRQLSFRLLLIRIKRIRDSFGQFLSKLSLLSRLVLVPICRFLCSKLPPQCLRHQFGNLDEYSLEFSRLFHYSIIKVLKKCFALLKKNLTAWCVTVSRGQQNGLYHRVSVLSTTFLRILSKFFKLGKNPVFMRFCAPLTV